MLPLSPLFSPPPPSSSHNCLHLGSVSWPMDMNPERGQPLTVQDNLIPIWTEAVSSRSCSCEMLHKRERGGINNKAVEQQRKWVTRRPETMRKRKRHQWRERTRQQVVRGEDSRCVDIPGTYGQSTQVRIPTLSQVKILELLWVLELSHSYLHEPGSSQRSMVTHSSKPIITKGHRRELLGLLNPAVKEGLHVMGLYISILKPHLAVAEVAYPMQCSWRAGAHMLPPARMRGGNPTSQGKGQREWSSSEQDQR